ncbi:MAG TPA: helix-turn-helix domain-containing protein [Bacteroidia bacterium]|jgi:DNA-binding HxlR family transcriptional regulator|nr:helix-turn-helix domain-containing protein [Bacteroidia bacterium]
MAKNFLENPSKLSSTECSKSLLPVQDALYILSGKWKIPIIIALIHGNKRFKELHREITGITAKMLSKELKELEVNTLVTRTVYDTIPVSVEYELTPYGTTLDEVIMSLRDWGLKHRQKIKERK